jgi:hypothetical protein
MSYISLQLISTNYFYHVKYCSHQIKLLSFRYFCWNPPVSGPDFSVYSLPYACLDALTFPCLLKPVLFRGFGMCHASSSQSQRPRCPYMESWKLQWWGSTTCYRLRDACMVFTKMPEHSLPQCCACCNLYLFFFSRWRRREKAREEARSCGKNKQERAVACERRQRGGCTTPTRCLVCPSTAIKAKLWRFVRVSLTR